LFGAGSLLFFLQANITKIDPIARLINTCENFMKVNWLVSARADQYGIVSMSVMYISAGQYTYIYTVIRYTITI
jgi:hypothetical protein